MIVFKKARALYFSCLIAASLGICAEENTSQPADAKPAEATPSAGRPLRQLIFGESIQDLEHFVPDPNSGFVVLTPALSQFDLVDLTKRMVSGENRIIEPRLLAAITTVMETFLRQKEYPSATAIVPSQSIVDGRVRIMVTLGAKAKSVAASEWKIRKINVSGARWFSESLLREKLRIEQGATVRFNDLDQAISWTNNNPYRRVRVQLEQVPNTGEADLNIAVQDAMPLRLVATVDNGGNDLVGKHRYVASLSYANLWGLDHQASYQYITTDKPKFYQAHGLDYRIPLPWRHYLQASASYFLSRPEIDTFIRQNGESVSSDLRYIVPLTIGNNSTELSVGFSFKESNNNLTWDPYVSKVQVFSTKTDIFQMTAGASTVRRDQHGAWAFGATLTASPGNINSRNTDRAFDAQGHPVPVNDPTNPAYDPTVPVPDSSRRGAKARYAFANFSAQRLLNLGHGWDLLSRATLQLSEANLLSSEQLTIGGTSTVRGFNESIFAGDNGFVFNNEFLTPSWKKNLPWISKIRGPVESRGLLFFDMAKVSVRHPYNEPPRAPLAGAGVGLRMNLANNFSLTADYGWQISHMPAAYHLERGSRAHLRVMLAF